MTQEQKDLLLKDLCERLPYGVVCADVYTDEKFINKWNILAIKKIDGTYANEFVQVCISNCEKVYGYKTSITNIKPYLFPLSSMTEEQSKIYHELVGGMFGTGVLINLECLIDFFDRNHLDWRGLIPLGLAIDATGKNVY